MQNPILDAVNKLLNVTGLQFTSHKPIATMDGLPLGVSESGELGLKVLSAGAATGGGALTPQVIQSDVVSDTDSIVVPAGADSVSYSFSSFPTYTGGGEPTLDMQSFGPGNYTLTPVAGKSLPQLNFVGPEVGSGVLTVISVR